MPLPGAFTTEDALADFMLAELGNVKDVLGWTSRGNIQQAVDSVLLAYGLVAGDDVADATDVAKIRAIARYFVWLVAVDNLNTFFQFQTDGQSFHREQIVAGARKSLKQAARLAGQYLTLEQGLVTVTAVEAYINPYKVTAGSDEYSGG
jgi:hypothetical protein